MKFLREYTISAHAPAGGATPKRGFRHNVTVNFYSRPCGRGDDDSTVVTLSPLGQAAYDHVRLKAMAVSIPILLSAVGVIVAILKP